MVLSDEAQLSTCGLRLNYVLHGQFVNSEKIGRHIILSHAKMTTFKYRRFGKGWQVID